ncbi:flagellar hook-length control protein FliK [Phreatobacter stygius]|uniref:Flagellar hook-length control protein-like C-terminal domain-containing protein n=1 Tax=Phreatobacter stygius TaxID=1940610 RepID=A0A4D7B094_9HYPH|nr:flagellar hook-length control protein FliK [Phreatobacter stygius]QCI64248.1 hypothetical protein E8M01_08325 [Phreatobacter stygius]
MAATATGTVSTATTNSVPRNDARARSGQGGARDAASVPFSEALDAEDKQGPTRPNLRPRVQPQRRPTIAAETLPAPTDPVVAPPPASDKREAPKAAATGDGNAAAEDKASTAPPAKNETGSDSDAPANDAPAAQPQTPAATATAPSVAAPVATQPAAAAKGEAEAPAIAAAGTATPAVDPAAAAAAAAGQPVAAAAKGGAEAVQLEPGLAAVLTEAGAVAPDAVKADPHKTKADAATPANAGAAAAVAPGSTGEAPKADIKTEARAESRADASTAQAAAAPADAKAAPPADVPPPAPAPAANTPASGPLSFVGEVAQKVAAQTAAAGSVVPVHAVAVTIAARANAGSTRFDIKLDPAELGRIEVSLTLDREGRVKSKIVAEKPETLELLQRDQRNLERALNQAGLNASEGSLEFSLKDQSNQGSPHDQPHAGQSRHWQGLVEDPDGSTAQQATITTYARLAAARGGVDIRI